MSKIYKTWMYSATEEPVIINSDEIDKYLKDGWEQTPAKFVSLSAMEIDTDNMLEVNAVGELIYLAADIENQALNLDTMKRMDIKKWAFEHFKIDLKIEKKSRMIDKFFKQANKEKIDLGLTED